MAGILADHGVPADRARPAGFASLLRAIVGQQVSAAAAAGIWSRVEKHFGAPDAARLHRSRDATLRKLGLSAAKVGYAKGLAAAITSGALDLDALAAAGDADVRARLMAIKGIGPWTAEVYLMFALKRPDVWPAGDLALAAAAERLLGLPQRPTQGELAEIGERWRPHRSGAALLLWHYYGAGG